MYIRIAKYFTVAWLLFLGVYVWWVPQLFLRMFPHEVGELLAGWFAPLAAVWVGAAVALQRDQLASQREEIAHASKALKMQADEFQRAIDDVKQNELKARTERLVERLMSGVERILRSSEYCELHDPTFAERQDRIATLLGTYQRYAELLHAREVTIVLTQLEHGLDQVSETLSKGWLLNVHRSNAADELCLELASLERVVGELCKLQLNGEYRETLGLPDQVALEAAHVSIANATTAIADLLHSIEELDH